LKVETVILITTKGFENSNCFPDKSFDERITTLLVNNRNVFHKVLEIDESVSATGEIVKPLKENSINDLLREVFALKPVNILIALQNSQFNPIHEKTLSNLLKAAGYRSVIISTDSASFNSFLSCMFANENNA
jgi:N-methylhydantoinase A/oxoprolinase/acetone carboxylase beta subunit